MLAASNGPVPFCTLAFDRPSIVRHNWPSTEPLRASTGPMVICLYWANIRMPVLAQFTTLMGQCWPNIGPIEICHYGVPSGMPLPSQCKILVGWGVARGLGGVYSLHGNKKYNVHIFGIHVLVPKPIIRRDIIH